MKIKKIIAIALCVMSIFAGTTIFAGCGKKSDTIYVGSKNFTESLIVGEIYALALEDAGFKVERELNIAGTLVHQSITSSEIDVYPEYTGTALMSYLQMDMISDPEELYNTVKTEYAERYDIVWLDQTEINDTNGFAMRKDIAERYGITTISDMARHASELIMASQGEFEEREDGLPGLRKHYNAEFKFKDIISVDNALKYQTLLNGQADITPAYSTEGQLSTGEFTYLIDDKNFFPPYYLAPVIRSETLEKFEGADDVLNALCPYLTMDAIIGLNARVDIDHEEYDDVARDFYENKIKPNL